MHTRVPPYPELWGLNQIREGEIFSQQLRPSDSVQREGIEARGEGTSSFPSSSRVMSQQKEGPSQQVGSHLIPSSSGSLPPTLLRAPFHPLLSLKEPGNRPLSHLAHRFQGNASLSRSIPKGSLPRPLASAH